ncbi:MAG: hypothetical protein JNK08_01615 [Sediminibacterium sp.]|nr:hypothetical protein [Sediminibacterium sp.]
MKQPTKSKISTSEKQLDLFENNNLDNNCIPNVAEKRLEENNNGKVIDLHSYKSNQVISNFYQEIKRLTSHLD